MEDDPPECDDQEDEYGDEPGVEEPEEHEKPVAIVDRAVVEADLSHRLGYVRCPVDPWAAKDPVGRITFWPDGKPAHSQNIGVRCYMHPNCSVSRKRLAFTTEQVLRWVFSMEPLPADATAEQKVAARQLHMNAKAAEFLPKAAAASARG